MWRQRKRREGWRVINIMNNNTKNNNKKMTKELKNNKDKHQLAEFFYKGKLLSSCKLSDLDLNDIQIKRFYPNQDKYLLESGKFYLAWSINEPVKSIDLFINGKKHQEIEAKSILEDYYPLFDKLFEKE